MVKQKILCILKKEKLIFITMRILIVEDQDDLRNLLRSRLEEECFVVDAARDGEQGSFMARTNEYDLILLDNHLPKKNGIEVCKDIRNSKKNIPILILSVLDDTLQKVELLEAGADDYLTKPFSFSELNARIRAILRRSEQMIENILSIDDLVLNSQKHEVYRGQQEIYLTKKEFMMLEFLMRSAGQVISRGDILEHVWDIHADPFSNTIETHILSLRRKIDTPGKTKLIHNLSGRGYKIGLKK